MSTSFGSFCDDFYFDSYLYTKLDLPGERDTLLSFFERIQKSFPQMCNLSSDEADSLLLEEDRDSGQYRFVTVDVDRIGAGIANPQSLEKGYELNRLVIELMPYMLGVSYLDVRSLDVSVSMDFDYSGDHNEIIAEALLSESPFGALINDERCRPLELSPGISVGLDDECRIQARLAIESRTSTYEVRTNKFKEDKPITLNFTIRQYPKPNEKFLIAEAFEYQCKLLNVMMVEKVIPSFVKPLTNAIAQRRK